MRGAGRRATAAGGGGGRCTPATRAFAVEAGITAVLLTLGFAVEKELAPAARPFLERDPALSQVRARAAAAHSVMHSPIAAAAAAAWRLTGL